MGGGGFGGFGVVSLPDLGLVGLMIYGIYVGMFIYTKPNALMHFIDLLSSPPLKVWFGVGKITAAR